MTYYYIKFFSPDDDLHGRFYAYDERRKIAHPVDSADRAYTTYSLRDAADVCEYADSILQELGQDGYAYIFPACEM